MKCGKKLVGKATTTNSPLLDRVGRSVVKELVDVVSQIKVRRVRANH